MMEPICVPCGKFFRVVENDYPFTVRTKLWLGDRWKCDGCAASIVVGVGRQPVGEEKDLPRIITKYLRVAEEND